jgi:hypothetical protein
MPNEKPESISVPTESRPTSLDTFLGYDLSGRSLPELLHLAAQMLTDRGDGPVADCLRDKAYQAEAAIAEAASSSLLPVPQTFELLRALTWMASLFDDEGNFREQYENQLSTALELADNALEKNTLHLGVHADICEHGVGCQTCAICTGTPKLASLLVGESWDEK